MISEMRPKSLKLDFKKRKLVSDLALNGVISLDAIFLLVCVEVTQILEQVMANLFYVVLNFHLKNFSIVRLWLCQ
jgi:hypothetical protein